MLEKILTKCNHKEPLEVDEIICLLRQQEPEAIKQIFAASRKVRQQHFQNHVYLYGFVYFSTYCQNNCSFCYYRKDNAIAPRYRKSLAEVVAVAKELKDEGVHLIDLTTGDDPYYTAHPTHLAEIIRAVKAETGLPVMLSPGLLDRQGLQMVSEAGADWYALYQETHNKELFQTLRTGQSYEARIKAKQEAVRLGMLIEEGLLTGVGDTVLDRAASFREMKRLVATQLRTMTYVPKEGGILRDNFVAGNHQELINIAVMRLLFPDALIPASLDVEGLEGLAVRLMAGANVVTSIIPPMSGCAGVANYEYGIDEGHRTVAGIQDTLKGCGLTAAEASEYVNWVETRKHTQKEYFAVREMYG